MKAVFEKMMEEAEIYLRRGVKKNFVLHTRNIVKAMELMLEKENGDENILIPAAILHDVGWCKVPHNLQRFDITKEESIESLKMHLEYAGPVIEEIMKNFDYSKEQVERIIDIVKAHKFQDPKDPDKQLLIDADALSDCFKEQFYSDCESYGTTPQNNYEFRKKNNIFYTKTATEIFENEMEDRKKEIEND